MEGTQLGIKSIAMSQITGMYGNGESFAVAEKYGVEIVRKLVALNFGPGVLMNVNYPDCRVDEVAGIDITMQGKRDQNFLLVDERKDGRGNPYYWIGFARERGNPPAGTDIAAVFNKRISITPLHMNLTQIDALEALRTVF